MFNNFWKKMYFIYAVSQVVRITNTFYTEMQNILFSIFVVQLHHIVLENLQLISCCGPESIWSPFPAGPRLTSMCFLIQARLLSPRQLLHRTASDPFPNSSKLLWISAQFLGGYRSPSPQDSKPCCYRSLKSELTNCAPDRNFTVGHSDSFGERGKDIFVENNKAPHTCPKSNRIPLCFQASFARLYCFQGKKKFERSLIQENKNFQAKLMMNIAREAVLRRGKQRKRRTMFFLLQRPCLTRINTEAHLDNLDLSGPCV